MVEFKEWPKIPRGQNETITITEKIDGTNACVIVQPVATNHDDGTVTYNLAVVGVQSRSRMLTSFSEEGGLVHNGDDNFGFAEWVIRNQELLVELGEGYHYGEWAGPGIQKNPMGLTKREFFLFNTARWNPNNPNLPSICKVVPVIYEGPYEPTVVEEMMEFLSEIRPYSPEGVVVWYHRTRRYEKHTYKYAEGKWKETN